MFPADARKGVFKATQHNSLIEPAAETGRFLGVCTAVLREERQCPTPQTRKEGSRQAGTTELERRNQACASHGHVPMAAMTTTEARRCAPPR